MHNGISNSSYNLGKQIGKIGITLISLGLFILYYDGIRINMMFPRDYQFYEHPEIHIPIIGMTIAFFGTYLFIKNFRKGEKVI